MATIISIEEIGYTDTEEYVYDLETEDGTFSTDDGLILKNTDSCYVLFNVDRNAYEKETDWMKEHFRLAEEAGIEITKHFKPPVELEFEKVMYPFMLYAKKRYAYLEWTNPEKPDHLDYKGIQIVRRDNCQYVKDVMTNVFHTLMYDRDVEKAKGIAKKGVKDLLNDKVDKNKLIISKSLNNQYKVDGKSIPWDSPGINHPHVKLALEIRKVDPMNAPKPPDRVPYIFIVNPDKKALQCDKVAHPDYLGKKKIDTLYYLQRQLKSPLDMIFEILIDDPSVLYKEEERKKINKNKGLQDITSFFK